MNPGLLPLEGGRYDPPGVDDFKFGPAFAGAPDWLNKPLLQAVIGALLVILLWWWASRNLKVKPSKGQFVGEYIYEFVRNGIARDILHHDYKKYLPYLLGLFSFVLVNNWFGEFFVFMLPTFSKIVYAYALALLAWVVYIGAGFARHGFKYLKLQLIPDGVPVYLYPMIIPLEFLSNFIVRPITLALRLFANMFAGHLLLTTFILGGVYMAAQPHLLLKILSPTSFLMALAMTFFELLVQVLQAYVFTLLAATYIEESASGGH